MEMRILFPKPFLGGSEWWRPSRYLRAVRHELLPALRDLAWGLPYPILRKPREMARGLLLGKEGRPTKQAKVMVSRAWKRAMRKLGQEPARFVFVYSFGKFAPGKHALGKIDERDERHRNAAAGLGYVIRMARLRAIFKAAATEQAERKETSGPVPRRQHPPPQAAPPPAEAPATSPIAPRAPTRPLA